MRDFPVEPGRVYVAGLSAGGAAAAIMGSTYPDLYAAIGVHSGLACGAARDMPSAFAAMRQGGPPAAAGSRRQGGSGGAVPTIVFHGDRDTTVSPVNGDQVIAQAKAAADLRTDRQPRRGSGRDELHPHRSGGRKRASRCWSSGFFTEPATHGPAGALPGHTPSPRGPDASREMMRFFLQHSTQAAPLC